jgi:hypothetical protein
MLDGGLPLNILTDYVLALKIFVFITIISFVRNHVGQGPLAIVVAAAISYLVLFQFWAAFGTLYLLYLLLMIGISGILIDFFFVSQMGGRGEVNPVDSGKDLATRQQNIQRWRQQQAAQVGAKMHVHPIHRGRMMR